MVWRVRPASFLSLGSGGADNPIWGCRGWSGLSRLVWLVGGCPGLSWVVAVRLACRGLSMVAGGWQGFLALKRAGVFWGYSATLGGSGSIPGRSF
jgi:hypothetical protein